MTAATAAREVSVFEDASVWVWIFANGARISASAHTIGDTRGTVSTRISADSAAKARMKPQGNLVDRELTGLVIGGFYASYNGLGFGFNENVYGNALQLELGKRGLLVQREVPKEVLYHGQPIALFRIDMLVEGRLVVEIKAAQHLSEVDHRQLLNYLRVSDLQLGLLLHYGPKPAFHRLICTNTRSDQT
jgi:GxxExxY protein